jgi:Ser/Thr protein kinase RdoA (MazF antagonist)
MQATLHAVLSQYTLPPLVEITPLTEGLIHQSYLVQTQQEWYVIQGLHPKLSSDGVLQDYDYVTAHLATHQYPGPLLIKTRTGQRAAESKEGQKWRLSTYVPGQTISQVNSVEQAYIGGKALGRFHQVISSLEYQFQSTHPGHDTVGHWTRFKEALTLPKHQPWIPQIQETAQWILNQLPAYFLSDDLPQVIVHGDPKITNLRFQQDQAILIDLDTCTYHTRLVDLGDAIRSWCHTPDAPLGERFSIERCKALLKGYLDVIPFADLSHQEQNLLSRCGPLITLELASRFGRDFLEDHYFAYDSEHFNSRRAHNLHRVGLMVQLAHEMQSAEALLLEYCWSFNHP